MDGITTRDPDAVEALDPAIAFYTVKRVDGETVAPRADAVNSIACFGDSGTGTDDPDRLAVDGVGEPATATRPGFDWDWVCPTDDAYRDRLLDCIDDCVAASPDVRLMTVGFPGEAFCQCEQCDRSFKESEYGDRVDWRAAVVTEFVESVAQRVPGNLTLTAHPDPYPGSLMRRRGVDLGALDDVVDEVLVPLCDPSYETTYWLETIARGFAAAVESRLTVQLSVPSDRSRLDAAGRAVTPHADQVIVGGSRETLRDEDFPAVQTF
ncbi:hypothetical protein HUG10_14620 [Halorarum halophilum]|uniref:Uncharacterized protein n=1 Tax=Halorarum halophilum TaxID=2743090 RepID=A0A7D5KXT3_9EURY|nr:hypothetical protein [Halobaculum halophilum]QLG28698.1 hypothetical protein HUG10_14620 [Halobaculum halophilum]